MNYSLSKNKSEFFLLDQSKKIDYLDIYGKKENKIKDILKGLFLILKYRKKLEILKLEI